VTLKIWRWSMLCRVHGIKETAVVGSDVPGIRTLAVLLPPWQAPCTFAFIGPGWVVVALECVCQHWRGFPECSGGFHYLDEIAPASPKLCNWLFIDSFPSFRQLQSKVVYSNTQHLHLRQLGRSINMRKEELKIRNITNA